MAVLAAFEFKNSYPQKSFLNLNEKGGWVFKFKNRSLLVCGFEFKNFG